MGPLWLERKNAGGAGIAGVFAILLQWGRSGWSGRTGVVLELLTSA